PATGTLAAAERPRRGQRAPAADTPAAAAPPPERPPHPPSLVRRLVVLHAVLSLLVLAASGVALSAFFTQQATTRFDDVLSQDLLALVAGASVDEVGVVTAPAFTDARALRVYSGKYWELATPTGTNGARAVARSRSLWDSPDLPPPPGGVASLAK